MVTRQNLITTFFKMSRRDKKLIDIPSHFNVFGLDKMRFQENSNYSICMRF